jgi:hypothetical protein
MKLFERSKFLIIPKFQLQFLAWMLGAMASVIVVFYGANLYFFNSYFQLAKSLKLPGDHVFLIFLNQQYKKMNLIFLVTTVIVFLASWIFGLFLSHRVAGPIYKFMKYLSDEKNTRARPLLKFRKNDFFQELAEKFNRFNKS